MDLVVSSYNNLGSLSVLF